MAKRKLEKFAIIETLPNVFQPPVDEVFNKKYKLADQWGKEYFKNSAPLILELGCGKGEYTLALAKKYSSKNFIGLDIKGARICIGAQQAVQENLKNAAFIRTRIEFIDSFFGPNEVDELWITFPDPQIKKRYNKKRLTSSRFLKLYQKLLKHNGMVNLKTDSVEMYDYTMEVIKCNDLNFLVATDDLYSSNLDDDILEVQTHYETLFRNQGKPIKYLKFELPQNKTIIEPPTDD